MDQSEFSLLSLNLDLVLNNVINELFNVFDEPNGLSINRSHNHHITIHLGAKPQLVSVPIGIHTSKK